MDLPPPSLLALLREKELWILILIGLLYWYRPLLMGDTFYFRDLYLLFWPKYHFLSETLKAREWPLWNPFMYGGLPFLADISNSVLSPATLLFLLLPPLTAFNLTIILHLELCGVFAYSFARVLGIRPVSSLIVGVMYAFCGYMLSLVNLLATFLNMPYVPLLALSWHLFMLERRRRWFACSILVGVFQAFSGSPEIDIIVMFFLLGWTLCYPYPHRPAVQKITLWALLGTFTVGLALIQIVPTLEMLAQSYRGQGLQYAEVVNFSLHPKQLPEFILPGFSGYVDKLPWKIHYWGGALVDEWNPLILSLYIGGVGIFLMIMGGVSRSTNEGFPAQARRFLLIIWIGVFIFAFGRFLPFFEVSYRYLPIVAIFRFPIKMLIAGILPCAVLIGYAVDLHFGRPAQEHTPWIPSRSLLSAMWAIAILLCALALVFWRSRGFAAQVLTFFFDQADNAFAYQGVRQSLFHTAQIWTGATLLYQSRRHQQRSWQPWILAGLITLDLLVAGQRINPTTPATWLHQQPPVANLIHREIGDGRLFRDRDPEHLILALPRTDAEYQESLAWGYHWNIDMLFAHLGALFNIPVVFHRDANHFAPHALAYLERTLPHLPWEQRVPFLSAAGVTLLLTHETLSLPGIQSLATIPNASNLQFVLYKNTNALAPAEFVTTCRAAESDVDALNRMIAPGFDPRAMLILQTTPLWSWTALVKPAAPQSLSCPEKPPSSCKGRITRNNVTLQSSEFMVEADCDGYVVFTEPFYPGWHVRVDGRKTPILRANFAFSAIALPAGTHTIERFYAPSSIVFGALGSAGFALLLMLIFSRKWISR